jgi:hypothetical protein
MVTQRSIQDNAEVQMKIALSPGRWNVEQPGCRQTEIWSGTIGIAIKFLGYKFL